MTNAVLGGDGAVRPAPPPKAGIRVILSDPAVRVAILIVFVIMAGFGIVAPILPLYARSFGVSYQTASLLISGFALARLIVDPFAGPLIDRYGERFASVSGAMLVGVSSFLTGIAPNFTMAVLLRAVGGAGSSVLFAALYSYLLKVVPSDRMARTLSLFFGALQIGIIAGGPLGGVLADALGLRAPLFVYAGLCLVAGVLYLRFMSDPAPAGAGPRGDAVSAEGPGWRGTLRQARELLRNPAFLTVIVLNMAFYWILAGGYDTLVPLFGAEGLGMSEAGVGALFGLAVFGEFLVVYGAASIADRVGRKPVLLVGLTALGLMMAADGWARTPVALGIMIFATGLASGSVVAAPGAILSDLVPGGGTGVSVGLFRFAGDLGFVLGPTVAGLATGAFGFRVAFALMAAPVAVALALVLRTPETLRRGTGAGVARPIRPIERSPLGEG